MTPETINGIFGISGAVVGSIAAGLIAWALQVKYRVKKSLKVLISRPKLLVDADGQIKNIPRIMAINQQVETITSIDYYLINTGNQALENIDIHFSFDGNIRILGGNCPKKNFKTNCVDDFSLHLEKNSTCNIRARFLNPGEEAKGHLLIRNMPTAVDVVFRQPNVDFKLKKDCHRLQKP